MRGGRERLSAASAAYRRGEGVTGFDVRAGLGFDAEATTDATPEALGTIGLPMWEAGFFFSEQGPNVNADVGS